MNKEDMKNKFSKIIFYCLILFLVLIGVAINEGRPGRDAEGVVTCVGIDCNQSLLDFFNS